MEITLKDNVALVTGGGAGIGRAIAETFAGLGAKVVVAEIDAGKVAKLAAGDILFQGFQRSLGFRHHGFIALGFAEFDHSDIILELALDLANALKRILQ